MKQERRMCKQCQELQGSGKGRPPHPDLELEETQRFSGAMGSADEAHYRCKACGHTLIYESGGMGYGWL